MFLVELRLRLWRGISSQKREAAKFLVATIGTTALKDSQAPLYFSTRQQPQRLGGQIVPATMSRRRTSRPSGRLR